MNKSEGPIPDASENQPGLIPDDRAGAAPEAVHEHEKLNYGPTGAVQRNPPARICGLLPWVMWGIVMAIVVIFAVALGVGIGEGLAHQHKRLVTANR